MPFPPLLLAALLTGPPAATLSGHLAHAPAAADSLRLTVGFRRVSAALSPAGDFRVALPFLREPTPTNLSCGDQQTQLYLTPGDQLTLHVDYLDFDKTMAYQGRGSEANNYLAQALYKFTYGPPAPGMLRSEEFPTGTPAEARQQATALRQARRAFLASYAQAHPRLPAAFVREQQVAIDAQYITQQLAYAYKHDAAPMPAGYFDFMADYPTQALNQLSKRSLIENSLLPTGRPETAIAGAATRHVPNGQLSTDPAEGPRLYALATQELGEGRARDWAMEMLIFKNMRDNLPGAQVFCRTFRLYNQDSAVARSLRQGFANVARVQPSQPAPSFTLTDLSGKAVSLSDFRGKVVYLDFWGTWCAPCLKEMTESVPALKNRFAGQDVVFLYVASGDAEDRW